MRYTLSSNMFYVNAKAFHLNLNYECTRKIINYMNENNNNM